MSHNLHPHTLSARADWRMQSLLAEVERQRLVRLAKPTCRRRRVADSAMPGDRVGATTVGPAPTRRAQNSDDCTLFPSPLVAVEGLR